MLLLQSLVFSFFPNWNFTFDVTNKKIISKFCFCHLTYFLFTIIVFLFNSFSNFVCIGIIFFTFFYLFFQCWCINRSTYDSTKRINKNVKKELYECTARQNIWDEIIFCLDLFILTLRIIFIHFSLFIY